MILNRPISRRHVLRTGAAFTAIIARPGITLRFHGHSFRVIARNGQPARHREWQDTVLMAPEERVEIAFVADNPGDWMFHCHILEHQAVGMMGVICVDPGTTQTSNLTDQ